MRRADDIRVWMVTGVLGSMALGIVLIPLRTVVAASNLAFVFVAFTIVVAEIGGRGPALVNWLYARREAAFHGECLEIAPPDRRGVHGDL